MQNPVYVLRKGHQWLLLKIYSGETARSPGPVCAGLHMTLGLPVGCWVPLETLLSALSPVAWQVWEPLNEARNLVVVMGIREMGPGVSQNSHYSRTCPLRQFLPLSQKRPRWEDARFTVMTVNSSETCPESLTCVCGTQNSLVGPLALFLLRGLLPSRR